MPNLLTERQMDVMRILWERGSSTVREAKERIDEDLAYTSVLTVFQTLEENGHIRHEREGKAYRYYPVTSRTDAADQWADHLWSLDGSMAQHVADRIREKEDAELGRKTVVA